MNWWTSKIELFENRWTNGPQIYVRNIPTHAKRY